MITAENVYKKRGIAWRFAFALAGALGILAFLSVDPPGVDARQLSRPYVVPEFTHTDAEDWINSRPLLREDLQGKVVLIDFWTFGCWNCYRSFPWLKKLESRFDADKFMVLGVHTPEFDHEKDRRKVAAKVKEFGLEHAVMIDNDFSYWKAMKNRYWPSFYIIDKAGKVRAAYVGEMRDGAKQASYIERQIESLLAETG